MVLSDREIKEYVKKFRMIEPFKSSQVRKGVISFGLSSYGYDFRLAEEFKIFTNVNSAIVDPKNFDSRAFVNFKGKVCTIPPNSFVLARSLEYFRIPRDVIGICLGKSTYARCGIVVNVTPLEPCYDKETELLTEDGWKKFSELKGDELVATLNKKGEIEYQEILRIQKFKYKGKLIRIKGRNIDLAVTPSHLLFVKKREKKEFEFIPAKEIYGKYNYELKRDGIWKGKEEKYFELPAIELDNYLSSLSLREKILDALENKVLTTKQLDQNCGYDISERKFFWHLPKLEKEDYLQRDYKREIINDHSLRVSFYQKIFPEKEFLFLKPSIKIPIDDWLRFFGIWLAKGSSYTDEEGNYITKITCFDEKKKEIIKSWLKKLPFNFSEIDTGFSIYNKQLHSYLSQFGKASQKFIPKEIKFLPAEKLKILLEAILLGDGNLETLTFTTSSKKLADDLQELIFKAGWAAIVREVPKDSQKERYLKNHLLKANFNAYKIRISKKQFISKIYKRSFSLMPYDDFVYDVTVPNHTLYVRRNGKACWSSNCWEGYVTVEISNTTPLPAKIYANEGICQVIFIKGSKECSISYADKKGKYQKQKKLTLPKI